MKLLLPAMLFFSFSAYADNHGEELDTQPEPINDPIVETCKITAEDIGKLQERAKSLEEQANIDMSASRPLINKEVRSQMLETWNFMMQNAEYYKNLDCHKHLYSDPRRAKFMKSRKEERDKGWFD